MRARGRSTAVGSARSFGGDSVAHRTHRRVALLSIHPRHANAIFQGEDGRAATNAASFRRLHVVVYATSPMKTIMGWFEVDSVEHYEPLDLEEARRRDGDRPASSARTSMVRPRERPSRRSRGRAEEPRRTVGPLVITAAAELRLPRCGSATRLLGLTQLDAAVKGHREVCLGRKRYRHVAMRAMVADFSDRPSRFPWPHKPDPKQSGYPSPSANPRPADTLLCTAFSASYSVVRCSIH